MPQYELNLRDYWQIIKKRWLVLAVILFIVLLISVTYTHSQKSVYQAVASVQWHERRTFAGLMLELAEVNYSRGDPMITQSKIITSLPVLEAVVKELKLVNENATPEEVREQAAAIQGSVSTSTFSSSDIIRIIVSNENPKLAADIANKVAEVYIAENLRGKSRQSRTVREFIEKQLEETTAKLKTSEEALAKFKEVAVPTGVALPLQDKLLALEAEHQSLLRKYTAIHPDVKNIEEQILQIKEKLKSLPQKELEYNRLNREVDINARLYNELKDKLEAARIAEADKIEDVSLVEPAAIPVAPISPHRSLNYLLGAIIGLMLGISGTFLVEQLDTSIGTIEDVEGFIKLPTLGIIPYLKTEGEKRSFTQKIWPKEFKGKEKVLRLRNQLLIHYSSNSPIFESYRILRTNIQTEVFKEKIHGKILLFSSSGPEEGKSITVSNLAIVFAQDGLHTLLIDGDMRRSMIHNAFGLKNKAPGLSDVLSGTNKLEEAVRKFTDILMGELGIDSALKVPGLDNLNILTSGSSPALPAELLSSVEMAALLEKMRGMFDLILIDSPPVMAVADATIIAPKTDGILLVYRVGKTARSVLLRTKTQLVESGAKVRGVILNNISPEIEMRYDYYYHYKYYSKYYTLPEEKSKKIKEQG